MSSLGQRMLADDGRRWFMTQPMLLIVVAKLLSGRGAVGTSSPLSVGWLAGSPQRQQ